MKERKTTSMKKIRPKPYVHILFQPHERKKLWYWAIKLRDGVYRRVRKDGDPCIREKVKGNATTCTEELLIGTPIEERIAVMNLHYAELEEDKRGVK